MSVDRRTPLDFARLDLAEPVEASPLLFDRLRVPCACGGTLIGEEYAFFPSTLFIRGTCLKCGPRSAMFAPPIDTSQRQHDAMISAELDGLGRELAQRYNRVDQSSAVTDFLQYLNDKASA